VFWVHASNAARFEQSFRDIADSVKIAGRNDLHANIFKLVADWLCNSRHWWLLVLDNVDDARFLLDRQAANSKTDPRPLYEYLPHCKQGSVLITTRNMGAAVKLVDKRCIIRVDPMEKAQAQALLEKKLGAQGDSRNTAVLAEVLEYMPLAIVQAAAYIWQKGPQYKVTEYLNKFKSSESQQTKLLSRDEGQLYELRRDGEAKHSIIVTWQISFEDILQTRPSAADLLSLMSFFDRQGIPKAVLQSRPEQPNTRLNHQERREESVESNEEDDDFEDDVIALQNFCLISTTSSTDSTTYEMHALVQLATRTWLAANGKLARPRQQFINNLCREFPNGEYKNWAVCQALFAHVRSAVKHQPDKDEKSSLAEWAMLLYYAAWYAWRKGNAAEAKMLAEQSMSVQEEIFGREHITTIHSTTMVAYACVLGGQWDAAGKLQARVTDICKRMFGADDSMTLTSMANQAIAYRNQGRWKEAEKLDVQVMETRKTKLGADHLDTLHSMGNLALTYRSQGQWKEAEELGVQVVETKKRVLGEEHPDTLISIANLALTYSKQGRWKEAEEKGVQVVETKKRVLGEEHPDTLISIAILASTYSSQGRWKEAEELGVQVLETQKMVLGEEHPDTLISIAILASTYSSQGRWKEAEELGVQVVETKKKVLGEEHPDTLISIANLALTYSSQGRWKEAEEKGVQVVETQKRVLGEEHPSTLNSIGNLASTYSKQGRWKEAEEIEVEVVEMKKRVLGEEHPSTLNSIGNLASTYRNQGRWKEAEELAVQVTEMRKRVLGRSIQTR
jgi:tetratricopeptide (TPR) repeat protein